MKSLIPKAKESDIQKTIIEGLSAKRIWHCRMNTGAMSGAYKGKRWFMRFGRPGMADILATPIVLHSYAPFSPCPLILWIEVKASDGKTSEAQDSFRESVAMEGHEYLVARSWEDVSGWLKEHKL